MKKSFTPQYRKHARLFVFLPTLLASTITQTLAASDELSTVEVQDLAPTEHAPIDTAGNNSSTVYRVNETGIALFGGAGNSNPYKVIDRLPGVNAQSADAFGLANIPGGTKGLRVRGELSTHGGGGNVDGLPLNGINPGPGNQWLFDLENMSAVTLSQGPVAPDHFAFFTTSGVLDSEVRWPQAKHNLQVAQSAGSNNFWRTFVRADSGQLENGSEIFLSASYTDADKWRGTGKSPAGRNNVEGAWSRPLGEHGKGKLLFAYNDAKANNYRPLTYSQASNLGSWRYYDYDASSSATATTAVNYYDYNRQAFQNGSVIGEFEYAFNDTGKVIFKPYYLKETGNYMDGMANGKVRQWLIDHDWYGFTAEIQTRLANSDLKLGYWSESSAPPGPPTAWKMYNPTASGGVTGASWSILADTTERHRFNSLYALADHSFDTLKIQAGGRYVRETLPGFNFYNTTGIGDVSYSQALEQSSGVVANRSASSFEIGEFLPFVALNYGLTPSADLKLSLGRNYGSPAFDIWPVFQQNSAAFLAKGYSIDKMWHERKAETADAFDLGLNLRTAQAYFSPTVFYSRNHNKGVSYDPGIGIAYSQNNGETHAYGIQASSGWNALSNLALFATASYTNNVFDQNLPLLNGGTLAVAGMQLPDTPKLQANIGGTWQQGDTSVTPMLRYNGDRYGDTLQTQQIDAYYTVDLTLAYKQRVGSGSKLNMSLAVQNLFDKEYIGFINASYYQLMSSSSAYYYPGAPRTIVASLSVDY